MWDMNQALPNDTVRALASLKEALDSPKELLRLGSEGSNCLVRLLHCLCAICLISAVCSALQCCEWMNFVPIQC